MAKRAAHQNATFEANVFNNGFKDKQVVLSMQSIAKIAYNESSSRNWRVCFKQDLTDLRGKN